MKFTDLKRKYLFCSDESGSGVLESLIQHVKERERPFEWYYRSELAAIQAWLNQQRMGSYLYLAGSREFVLQVKKWAEEAGFSEEEMQWEIVGDPQRQIFCCRCHGLHFTAAAEETLCPHCGLELKISDHYSRRWEVYLGYVDVARLKTGGGSQWRIE
ncbi:dimethylamine monooxygenase subunit DmmA family protein [Ammoniphilus sp. CFH 90114]|uniref:dimethylamine monooxygenase subunit DmmA family protein n=1 Tax=Ammoniphilus sp. CFH 90114 TaxID=2493665 RepID=UPI00100F367F|nr:dimethylamine monooxygenase subunit DmmA family protein [Ammoniphilus sp. CFH 90114]RXT04276.1 hypothetical protein EIZ39_20555 [Ammoniphilus sp. CFH 90114]